MAMKIKYFIFSFMCHLCPFADEREKEGGEREKAKERKRNRQI